MSNHGVGAFIDFFPCPICIKDTRHYNKDTKTSRQNRTVRVLICEKCGVLRMQVSDGVEGLTWHFGMRT